MNAEESKPASTLPDGEGGQGREISPDLKIWSEGLHEVSNSAIVECFRFLRRRSSSEVTTIVSMTALASVEGRIVAGGGGLSASQGLYCVLTIAFLIFVTPIFHHALRHKSGNQAHDAQAKHAKEPPDARTERASQGEAGEPADQHRG